MLLKGGTPTLTFTPNETIQNHQLTFEACSLTVEANRSAWRKPKHAQGERAKLHIERTHPGFETRPFYCELTATPHGQFLN